MACIIGVNIFFVDKRINLSNKTLPMLAEGTYIISLKTSDYYVFFDSFLSEPNVILS